MYSEDQLEMFDNQTNLFDTNQETKLCPSCGNYLPLNSFPTSGRMRKDGTSKLRNKCKSCKTKDVLVLERLKEKYPKPPENYKCPICLSQQEDLNSTHDITSLSTKNKWCLDHDHETLEFRGWLCNTCNSAMGWFRDDLDILKRAVKYLEGKL